MFLRLEYFSSFFFFFNFFVGRKTQTFSDPFYLIWDENLIFLNMINDFLKYDNITVSFSIQIVILFAILVSDRTIPEYHICAKLI